MNHIPESHGQGRTTVARALHALLFALLWLALCGVASPARSDSLKPFTTDGCSMFPEGTPKQQSLWAECCLRHDLAYWQGGTHEQRLAADRSLQECVADLGEPEIAKLMLAGVRFGGSPYFPTPFRWGYGWSYQRGYAPLTQAEIEQVREQLQRLRIVLQSLDQALESSSE
jgi:hypothetical protein